MTANTAAITITPAHGPAAVPGLPPAVSAAVWVLLVLAIGLSFARLVLGPDLADRAVVLDLLATLSQGALALYAIMTRQPALLDVAVAIALLSFLGTIAFARYIERKARAHRPEGGSGHG